MQLSPSLLTNPHRYPYFVGKLCGTSAEAAGTGRTAHAAEGWFHLKNGALTKLQSSTAAYH